MLLRGRGPAGRTAERGPWRQHHLVYLHLRQSLQGLMRRVRLPHQTRR